MRSIRSHRAAIVSASPKAGLDSSSWARNAGVARLRYETRAALEDRVEIRSW